MAGADPKLTGSPLPQFGRGPTGLHGGLTLALGLLLLAFLFAASLSLPAIEGAALLGEPIGTSVRVFERRLELVEAVRKLPDWERALLAPLLPAGEGTREQAIAAFESVIAHRGFAREDAPLDEAQLDGLRARRALLLDEVGRLEEAQGDLDALAARGHAEFVALLRRSASTPRPAATGAALAIAGDGWIGCSARARLGGEPWPRPSAATERALRVARTLAAVIAAGAAFLLAWAARNRPDGPVGRASVPAPWPAPVGVGTLVRAGFLTLLILFGLESLATTLGSPVPRAVLATAGSIPLVLIARRHLLRPQQLGWRDVLGLGSPSPWQAWIPTVLGLFALDQIGSRALATAAESLGATTPWTAGIGEDVIASSPALLAISALDTVIVGAIAIEVAFRGVLFPTLRATHGRMHAAILTGLLFAAMQLAGLPGLLALGWSGVVYALAVERTRSLIPAVACRILASGFGLAEAAALYR